MRALIWLLRAAVFFVLFAFALNNNHEASLKWFFGREWQAPMVFIVLAAFACGCGLGIAAMLPSWWKHRRVAQSHAPGPEAATAATAPGADPLTESAALAYAEHPPRDGV